MRIPKTKRKYQYLPKRASTKVDLYMKYTISISTRIYRISRNTFKIIKFNNQIKINKLL